MVKEARINSEGRVVIPADMRKELQLKTDDVVVLESSNGSITMTPKQERCVICHTTENLVTVEGVTICTSCGKKLLKLKSKFK